MQSSLHQASALQPFRCNADVDFMLAASRAFWIVLMQQTALYSMYALLAAGGLSTSLPRSTCERNLHHSPQPANEAGLVLESVLRGVAHQGRRQLEVVMPWETQVL